MLFNTAKTNILGWDRLFFNGTSWQFFTMFCNLQQELTRFVGMDNCLISLKSNYIHFEGMH